jgi:uncharacterized protein
VAARFRVRLTPRGGLDQIDGVATTGELLARVRAVPDGGAANAALERLVASELGVPRALVILESGRRGRRKQLRVDGVEAAAVQRRWPGLAVVDAPDRRAG